MINTTASESVEVDMWNDLAKEYGAASPEKNAYLIKLPVKLLNEILYISGGLDPIYFHVARESDEEMTMHLYCHFSRYRIDIIQYLGVSPRMSTDPPHRYDFVDDLFRDGSAVGALKVGLYGEFIEGVVPFGLKERIELSPSQELFSFGFDLGSGVPISPLFPEEDIGDGMDIDVDVLKRILSLIDTINEGGDTNIISFDFHHLNIATPNKTYVLEQAD
jgi:hypothetical protein